MLLTYQEGSLMHQEYDDIPIVRVIRDGMIGTKVSSIKDKTVL